MANASQAPTPFRKQGKECHKSTHETVYGKSNLDYSWHP